MSLQSIVRSAVVRSNPFWPFSTINRLPYSIALDAFVRRCRSFPQVTDIYLRHGLTRSDWIPGISDIDLTVICTGHESAEDELKFLRAFRSAVKRQKKLFPILGEVDILSREALDSWSRFSIRGFEVKSWAAISGKTSPRTKYREHGERVTTDALSYAITIYKRLVIPRMLDTTPETAIDLLAFAREILKLERYAFYGSESNYVPTPYDLVKTHDRTALCGRALRALRGRVTRGVRSAIPRAAASLPRGDKQLDPACRHGISSILTSPSGSIVVLKNDLADGELAETFRALHELAPTLGTRPLVVESAVLDYLLRVYNPLLRMELEQVGRCEFGEYTLPSPMQNDREIVHGHILGRSANVLLFPSSGEVISPPLRELFAGSAPGLFLQHVSLIRMLTDDGELGVPAFRINAEARKRYPADYEALEKLAGYAAARDDGTVQFAAFDFFRRLADETLERLQSHD